MAASPQVSSGGRCRWVIISLFADCWSLDTGVMCNSEWGRNGGSGGGRGVDGGRRTGCGEAFCSLCLFKHRLALLTEKELLRRSIVFGCGSLIPFTDRGTDEDTRLLSSVFLSAQREVYKTAQHGNLGSWLIPLIGGHVRFSSLTGGLLRSDWIRLLIDIRTSSLFPAVTQGEISSPPFTFHFLYFQPALDPPPAAVRCSYCCHGAASDWVYFFCKALKKLTWLCCALYGWCWGGVSMKVLGHKASSKKVNK